MNEQLVAYIMAIVVVDPLESIKIQVGDSDLFVTSLRLQHRLLQTVGQKQPVGQMGKRIKVCDVLKLFLLFLDGRDV